MTVQEVIHALEAAGWKATKSDDELHRLHRDNEAGAVTIAGKLELSVPLGVQRILWRHAKIEEAD